MLVCVVMSLKPEPRAVSGDSCRLYMGLLDPARVVWTPVCFSAMVGWEGGGLDPGVQ